MRELFAVDGHITRWLELGVHIPGTPARAVCWRTLRMTDGGWGCNVSSIQQLPTLPHAQLLGTST
jgi:hypothetical protein